MIDKKTVAISVLIVLVGIAGIGWFKAWSKTAPKSTRDLTEIFHGYEAYLDRGVFFSTVSGSSMEPTFGEGDVVLWVEVDNKAELKVGDIIIYQYPPEYRAHRIIEVGRSQDGKYWFGTKGDGELNPDPGKVWEDKVRGLVIGVIYHS